MDANFYKRPCHALTKTGKPCQEEAEKGEFWCLAHLRRGFKIFDKTVAVDAAAGKLFKLLKEKR
jgi:hypothetical protein